MKRKEMVPCAIMHRVALRVTGCLQKGSADGGLAGGSLCSAEPLGLSGVMLTQVLVRGQRDVSTLLLHPHPLFVLGRVVWNGLVCGVLVGGHDGFGDHRGVVGVHGILEIVLRSRGDLIVHLGRQRQA